MVWPMAVEAFKTSDGEMHESRSIAEWRQSRLDNAVKANELLQSGVSLGESLRQSGLAMDGMYAELDDVFVTTKLIISHWQCRDTPGYSPIRITHDQGVFVHGDAGSWSGSYGSMCSPSDVVRYWADTKDRLAREAARGAQAVSS